MVNGRSHQFYDVYGGPPEIPHGEEEEGGQEGQKAGLRKARRTGIASYSTNPEFVRESRARKRARDPESRTTGVANAILNHYFPSSQSYVHRPDDYVVQGFVDINTHQWVPVASLPVAVTATLLPPEVPTPEVQAHFMITQCKAAKYETSKTTWNKAERQMQRYMRAISTRSRLELEEETLHQEISMRICPQRWQYSTSGSQWRRARIGVAFPRVDCRPKTYHFDCEGRFRSYKNLKLSYILVTTSLTKRAVAPTRSAVSATVPTYLHAHRGPTTATVWYESRGSGVSECDKKYFACSRGQIPRCFCQSYK